MQGEGIRDKGLGKTPVRGTQSFVGVMAEVFKRPSLVGIEIGWRAACALVLLIVIFSRIGVANVEAFFAGVPSFFNIGLLHHAFIFGVRWKPFLLLWFGVSTMWAVVAGLGRGAVLRRCEPRLSARIATVVALCVIRAWSFVAVSAVWLRTSAGIYLRLVGQAEPNYVGSFAMLVSMTLVMFVAWCTVSWVLQLAPVMAMGRGLGVGASIAAAWRSGPLRSKLIEINLVMGIVKVALLVLALVFSACPLPFSSVETQEFLTWWWIGVAVWWLVASDYFHVVRAAAYVRLWERFEDAPTAN